VQRYGLRLGRAGLSAAHIPNLASCRKHFFPDTRWRRVTLGTLNSHRGKGQQKVTVEHVHVHGGGGECKQIEDQAHAKQIGHAPQSAMRGPDTSREALPIAGNAERAMPDARRSLTGRSEG